MRSPGKRAALLSALVDFQKAQCFFMLTFQPAIIIAAQKGGLLAKSWQEYFENDDKLGNIALAGFLPVTFVLFTLHKAGMRSLYVLFLSICTVVVAGVTSEITKKVVLKPTIDPLDSPRCGLDHRPYLICPGQTLGHNELSNWRLGYLVYTFCCVAIVILVVDIIFPLTNEGHVVFQKYAERWNLWRMKSGLIKKIIVVFLVVWDLAFVSWLCYFVVLIGRRVKISNTWTLGQSVAVAIFVPSLIEYGYLALCK